ncbi:hypothetical protein C8R43DRAFT_1138013 [Mycena crocata]|nr:hypothetical protein C8R43DRAFT_1138013 [Mycena crocata]
MTHLPKTEQKNDPTLALSSSKCSCRRRRQPLFYPHCPANRDIWAVTVNSDGRFYLVMKGRGQGVYTNSQDTNDQTDHFSDPLQRVFKRWDQIDSVWAGWCNSDHRKSCPIPALPRGFTTSFPLPPPTHPQPPHPPIAHLTPIGTSAPAMPSAGVTTGASTPIQGPAPLPAPNFSSTLSPGSATSAAASPLLIPHFASQTSLSPRAHVTPLTRVSLFLPATGITVSHPSAPPSASQGPPPSSAVASTSVAAARAQVFWVVGGENHPVWPDTQSSVQHLASCKYVS